jgi:glucose-1-phosphate adenylyltransferase
MEKVLAMVLAGGEGKRLYPLTRDRTKPAVPFGGRYRLVDFVLSNFANSGLLKIVVLTQYKSHSLNRHLATGWTFSGILGQYVTPLPAQRRIGPIWYRGSADAIYQNLNVLREESPDHVCVFGADHIYRMDVNQMLRFHIERDADCTVAAMPVPRAEASRFGVMACDDEHRMTDYREKPLDAPTMPDDPGLSLASMGNYVFRREVLEEEVKRDAACADSVHDFGASILPGLSSRRSVFVYDFRDNAVSGQAERERAYWRDVGTIDAYYRASMDLIAVEPVFSLYNDRWPIFTARGYTPPAKFVHAEEDGGRVGRAVNSLVCGGVIVSGALVERSIVGPDVRLNSYSHVEDSIIFDRVDVGRHARIRRAIIDKSVRVPEGFEIGYDLDQDRERFYVSEGGVVVVPRASANEP